MDNVSACTHTPGKIDDETVRIFPERQSTTDKIAQAAISVARRRSNGIRDGFLSRHPSDHEAARILGVEWHLIRRWRNGQGLSGDELLLIVATDPKSTHMMRELIGCGTGRSANVESKLTELTELIEAETRAKLVAAAVADHLKG